MTLLRTAFFTAIALVLFAGSAPATQPQGGVRFTSTPPGTGEIGVEYYYDAEAVGGDPSTLVLYRAVMMPAGASLDTTTGEIRWTPTADGKVTFKIAAYLQSNPTITANQSWYVTVGKDSTVNPGKCALVNGTVVDQNNTPMNGTIYITNTGTPRPMTYSGKILNGMFSVYVADSGMYLIKATGPGFVTEWYQDAADEANAAVIPVRCGDSVTVSMIVASQQVTAKIIMGTVRSAANNAGIAGVKVIATTVVGMTYKAVTDAQGVYILPLPMNEQYVLQAVDYTGAHESQYYNGVADKAHATPIILTGDLSGIDFLLPVKQVYSNGISGTVQDSAAAPLMAMVKLFRIEARDPSQPIVMKVGAALTDSLGSGLFSFSNLTPGEYILYVIPYDRQHVPGYYKSGAVAVPDWPQATRITVDSTGIVSGIVITMQRRWGLTGGVIVRGTIRAKVGGFAAGGAPLPEATAILYDAAGRVSDYAVSDANGFYEMNQAPVGTVTLFVQLAGYASQSSTFEITGGTSAVDRSVDIAPSSPTSVNGVPSGIAVTFNVYPNPASSRITLAFSAPARDAGIVSIYNILGMRIASEVISAGATQLGIELGNIPPGLYLAVAKNGTQQSSVPFRIAR